MMKKTAMIIALLLSFQWCQAQEAKHEFQVGYGPFTRHQFFGDLIRFSGSTIFQYPLSSLSFGRSIAFSYHYQPRRRVAFGGNASFGVNNADENRNWFETGDYKSNHLVVSFETQIFYLQKPTFTLYSLVGAGGLFLWKKDQTYTTGRNETYAWPTGQITPVGVRVGKGLGIFAELGYGYKGLVNVGFSGRF